MVTITFDAQVYLSQAEIPQIPGGGSILSSHGLDVETLKKSKRTNSMGELVEIGAKYDIKLSNGVEVESVPIDCIRFW